MEAVKIQPRAVIPIVRALEDRALTADGIVRTQSRGDNHTYPIAAKSQRQRI